MREPCSRFGSGCLPTFKVFLKTCRVILVSTCGSSQSLLVRVRCSLILRALVFPLYPARPYPGAESNVMTFKFSGFVSYWVLLVSGSYRLLRVAVAWFRSYHMNGAFQIFCILISGVALKDAFFRSRFSDFVERHCPHVLASVWRFIEALTRQVSVIVRSGSLRSS